MMKHQRLQSCDFGTIKHVGTSIQEWSRENYVILLAVKVPQTNFFFFNAIKYLPDCYLFCSDQERYPIFTSFVLNINEICVFSFMCILLESLLYFLSLPLTSLRRTQRR